MWFSWRKTTIFSPPWNPTNLFPSGNAKYRQVLWSPSYGCAVRAILPAPERRGLPRTGSSRRWRRGLVRCGDGVFRFQALPASRMSRPALRFPWPAAQVRVNLHGTILVPCRVSVLRWTRQNPRLSPYTKCPASAALRQTIARPRPCAGPGGWFVSRANDIARVNLHGTTTPAPWLPETTGQRFAFRGRQRRSV